MKNRVVLLVLLVAGVIGVYLYFGRSSDEQEISANLAEMIGLVEKRGDESVFVLVGDSRRLMRFIAENPEIDLGSPLPVISDRDELEGMIIQVRQGIDSLSVRVVRKELTVSAERDRAEMELEVVGSGSWFEEGGRDRRNFSIGWVKEGGDWKVEQVRHQGPLIR